MSQWSQFLGLLLVIVFVFTIFYLKLRSIADPWQLQPLFRIQVNLPIYINLLQDQTRNIFLWRYFKKWWPPRPPFMKSLFFPVHFLPYRTRICCWMFGLDQFSRELKNTFCQDCKRNQLAKHRRCTSWVVSFKSKKFGPINQIANSLTQSEM